jgi:hypothetical protein
VAQGVGPEFKPQHHTKKKQQKTCLREKVHKRETDKENQSCMALP